MLKLKKDFSCVLTDKKTGKTLCTFDAQQVGDETISAGYVGGNVASGSQSMTVMTEHKFDYKPYDQYVTIEGKRWVLTSFTPSVRRRLGAGVCTAKRYVYILNLE